MNQATRKRTNFMYFVLAVLLFVFCVMKVLRGADTESTQAGGIWNYISLLYYPLVILWVMSGQKFRVKSVFVTSALYSVFAFGLAFLTSEIKLNISGMYTWLMIPYFFLVFSAFYIYTEDTRAGNNIIMLCYVICLVLNFMNITKYLFQDAERAMASDIYFSLGLFPFALVLIKNKGWKTFFIVAQFFTVFLANKRTGLIAFALGLVIYSFVGEACKEKRNMLKLLRTILVLAVVIVLFFNISMRIDSAYNLGIYDRLFGLQEDQGSGRGQVYSAVWEGFMESSFMQKLFGHGINTAGALGGYGHAHNDFLEILYNFGAIAFVCIVWFYIALIGEAFKMIKNRSPYAGAYCYSLVIGLFLGMFSYFLVFYTYVTCVTAFWGFILKKEKLRLTEAESL